MNTRHPIPLIVGISAVIVLCNLLLVGCGAGTGQSLNSPSLSTRGGDTSATGATKAQISSVLPSKRLGLFLADYVAAPNKTPGAADKPGTFARAANTASATDYAHVWVTVYKVELVSADDQTFPIWADDAGRVVDLATLRDATGERVALLGGVPAPGVTGKKTYKRARITLGKSITFLKRGDTSVKPTPIDDAVGRDDEGRPVLTALIDRPRDLGNGKEDLILAFDRDNFKFADGRVTPSMREASGGISTDPSRQEPATFVGIVSEPTAGGDGPERVFALTPDAGAKGENLLVWLRTSAPFFRADGKPSPVLTDGIRVVVHGRLQPNTKRVLAESVAVLADGERPADTASVSGDVSDANADAGSFAVTARDLRQIEPAYAAVRVTLGEGAVMRSASGLTITKDALFSALKKAGEYAEAEGEYEPTTGILVASRVRLVKTSMGDAPREASLLAVAKTVGDKSLTLSAPLAEWDGIVPPAAGKSWTVNTTVGTVCRDKDGKSIALTDLLTAAKDPDAYAVRVVGTYAGGAITASRLELRPAPVKEVAKKADKPAKDDKDGVSTGDATKGAATKSSAKAKADAKETPKPEPSDGII